MTVTLKPEHERMIANAIESGAYESPEQVVARALDDLRERGTAGISPLQRSQLAGQRIRELRRGVALGGISIKELVEEGRV